jgi:hypothetical protein
VLVTRGELLTTQVGVVNGIWQTPFRKSCCVGWAMNRKSWAGRLRYKMEVCRGRQAGMS